MMSKADKTILYVDDEIQNLQGFKVVFYKEFTIYTAQSAQEALEILKENQIKVVISDQRMPEMSGLEFLSIVNSEYKDVVCIILTAFADTEALMKAVNQGGVYRFLMKPWNEFELKVAINNALERYNLRNENKKLIDDLQLKNAELQASNEELRMASEALMEREMKLKEQNEEYLALNEELKQTNEELAVSKDRAEEADKLKTAFLQNMSHEIRTPMNAIMGFSNLLKDNEDDLDTMHTYIDIIITSGSQLLSIVDDILTISAIDTGQTKVMESVVDLNKVLNDLLIVFSQNAARKGLEISMFKGLSDLMALVTLDKTKFLQVLSNLLTNAIKYTHTGTIEFGYNLHGRKLEFYVKDSGIGISRENQKIIFERFRQVSPIQTGIYGGTGLGLAISKAHVELLRGEIWVESDGAQGSTFFFTLPYQPINTLPEVPGKPGEMRVTLGGYKVLVVEDELYNFLLIKEMIKDLPIEARYAKNGLEAIDAAKSDPDLDLVLMDIKMPIMDGFEACQIINSSYPSIPIVAQTAYAQIGDKERILSSGFRGYLSKPIQKTELLKVIHEFIK